MSIQEETEFDLSGVISSLAEKISSANAECLFQSDLESWSSELTQLAEKVQEMNAEKKNATPPPRVVHPKGPSYSFPLVQDRGRLEERQIVGSAAKIPVENLQDICMCLLAVLETIMVEVQCDSASLLVPYRGLEDEFRCMCTLSTTSETIFSGSGLLRGCGMESTCQRTGYLINSGPKSAVIADQRAAECAAMLDVLHPSRKKPVKSGTVVPSRLCSPIKASATAKPSGVVSVIAKPGMVFTCEQENFVFDASIILGVLLERCEDLAELQKYFAKGDLRSRFPARSYSSFPIPERRTQLVTRSNFGVLEGSESVKLPSTLKDQKTNLREDSAITSVFKQLERMHLSWCSAVKLNVELKRSCEEKDLYISSLLTRVRVIEKAAKEQADLHQAGAAESKSADRPSAA